MSPKSISKTPAALSPKAELKSILGNTIDGAVAIESRAIELCAAIAKGGKGRWQNEIKSAITSISERFRSMANITNLQDFITAHVDATSPRQFTTILRGYQHDLKQNRIQTVATTAKVIRKYKTIFTLSNSGTVFESVLKAKSGGWRGRVHMVESRPKNEGLIMARRLADKGIELLLAVDAAIPHLIAHSDAVFLGADAVTSGLFLNKIGSKVAVDYAAKFRIPCFIIFDKSKQINIEQFPFEEKPKAAAEIVKSAPKKLQVFNKYFEAIVPLGNVRYICGNKLTKPKAIIK